MTTSGPFTYEHTQPGFSFMRKIWYRQRPRTSSPNLYSYDHYFRTGGTYGDPLSWGMSAIDSQGDYWWQDADNRNYLKIVDEMKGKTAAWGANLATWKQSHDMIVGRAVQLLSAANQLRRGRFIAAAKTLGIRKPRPRHARDLAGQWLELSYGWLPLLTDIHESIQVMQEPLPKIRLKHTTKLVSPRWVVNPGSTPINSYKSLKIAKSGCTISAIHNGTYLANKLGLVNPMTVLWEIVPFSFVVDWFLPVGRFLESFTDFVGVTVLEQYTTHFGVLDYDVNYSANWGQQYGYANWSARRVQMNRALSLPQLTLRPRFTGFYSMRGANAIALLVGGLKRLR